MPFNIRDNTKQKNILTIDLEEWFHANYHANVFDQGKKYIATVHENTKRLLELFEKSNSRATFFVLGYVAENHPELIREISARGHEIASHGYGHQLVYQQTREEFRADVRKSVCLLENLLQVKVKGYRAPSWSISDDSLWALEELAKLGLMYDASVFPIKTYLYGMPSSPRFAYRPEIKRSNLNLIEIPASTVRIFNKNIPFSGGFYFRVLPYSFISYGIKRLNNEGEPAIIYLHPREIDPNQPHLKLNLTERLIHYWGISECEKKLTRLLQEYRFCSISDYYSFS